MPEILGSANAGWHRGSARQKSLAVPELGGAIADVDIEVEISRARTYSMGGSDLLGGERKLPAAVATGILILGDATSVIKVVGVLLIMLGIFASESKGFPKKKTRQSRPIEL